MPGVREVSVRRVWVKEPVELSTSVCAEMWSMHPGYSSSFFGLPFIVHALQSYVGISYARSSMNACPGKIAQSPRHTGTERSEVLEWRRRERCRPVVLHHRSWTACFL